MMLEFLQTGKAIYVLAAICLLGLAGKLTARSLYKRLIKESGNMMLTKNKWLREFLQRAEDTYRLNQGMANTRIFVEKQIYEAKMGLFTPGGWTAFSNQMTALCFLIGGAAAFLSYWYRCDSYYIILYGSMGILTGIFNIMIDYGAGLEDKRQRLTACIQDYLENTLWKRMGRDRLPDPEEEKDSAVVRQASAAKEPVRLLRGRKRETVSYGAKGHTSGSRNPESEEESENAVSDEALSQLRKSLEQAAAGRSSQQARPSEKGSRTSGGTSAGENWMKDLKPEEIKVLGEIIREYLG